MQNSILPAKSLSVKLRPTSTGPSAEASNDWDPHYTDDLGGSATPKEDLSLSGKRIVGRGLLGEEEDAMPGHAGSFLREGAVQETNVFGHERMRHGTSN